VISPKKSRRRSDHSIQPIRRKLLAWFRREKRQLPWRGTRDPYRIWVSEVMLQQTTVNAVRNRYAPFLARFPNLRSLARAREESVLAAWSGLGYYARARNLRRAAQVIEREHQGRLPRNPAQLERLPGFGRYMAAAVASLAYGERAPAAEANVTRVLSRLFAIEGIAGRRPHQDRVLSLAERLLPRRNPGDLTAAFMDLGQTICTPREPRCPRCPVREECRARRMGEPERYPERRGKPRFVHVAVAAAVARRGAHALLVRPESRRLAGMWQFPSAEGATLESARRDLSKMIRRLGWHLTYAPAGRARHTIMNRRMEICVFEARAQSSAAGHPSLIGESRWFRRRELERAAIPTLTRKIAKASGFL
jgi:A/G-specific adenine glycosylase